MENKWRLIIPSTSRITYHIAFVIVRFWCSSIRPKCRNQRNFERSDKVFCLFVFSNETCTIVKPANEQINNNNIYAIEVCVLVCVSLKFIIQSEAYDLSMWYFKIAYSFLCSCIVKHFMKVRYGRWRVLLIFHPGTCCICIWSIKQTTWAHMHLFIFDSRVVRNVSV